MKPENLSRKRFIGLGAAFAVVPLGAACDGEESEAPDPATTSPEETTQSAPPKETTENVEETTATETTSETADVIASASDVPPGSATEFEDAVLVHLDGGGFVAYSAVCTHRGCTVAYEEGSGELACPCHGSVFDPANGAAVVSGPATAPLAEIPGTERDGSIMRA
jgi:Rieske Fe-S protein